MTFCQYKNKKRPNSNGSQSEKPTVKQLNDTFIIGGYQNFTIDKNNIKLIGNYANKFNFIKKFITEHQTDCTSLTDIGASNGLVVFIASQAGLPIVHALDHDIECINLILTVAEQLQLDIKAKQYSFGEPVDKSDIVIMGALIHWVFSCTASYGNFDSIMEYLQKIVGKYLLIEWVDPADPAVLYFNHVSFNKSIIKEPYNLDNFLTSAKKFFPIVEKVVDVTSTRKLYLFSIP